MNMYTLTSLENCYLPAMLGMYHNLPYCAREVTVHFDRFQDVPCLFEGFRFCYRHAAHLEHGHGARAVRATEA
jgi:hypothetical protein